MSLKVWLPLDGDLRNLGCSDVTITNNGATVNNDGKIGKCYSPATITLTNLNNLSFNNSSYCFWAKTNSTTNWQLIIGIDNSDNSQIHGIYVADSTRFKLEYNPSLNVYNAEIGSWHHYAFIVKDGKSCCYYDGVLQTTSSEAVTNDTIGRLRLGVGTSIFLNDVRIYDHCLSAAEVKEIAQGLVVHYKLNGGLFGNPNLLAKYVVPGQAAPTSTADGGRTTWLGDYKITIPAAQNADTYFRLFMTEQLVSGTTYTISCKVSGLLDGSYYRFPLFAQSNTDMGLLYIDHNGLCSLTFTMNWTGTQTAATGANGETVYVNFLDDAARSLVSGQGPITLYDFKLEKGDTATPWCPADSELAIDRTIISDSSGYNHNATASSVLATTSDTPRYTASTALNGTTTATIEKFFPDNVLIPELTYACWVKRTYTTATARDLYRGILRTYLNSYGGIDFRPFITWTHATTSSSSTNSWTTGDTIPINTWVHMAWTFKDGLLKYYQNGAYVAQSDRTGTGQFIKTNFHTGLFGIDTSTAWQGNLSDMRIYTTALLDNDIKLLYNMGMRVDNLQNLHTFEYKENTSNLFRSELIMPFAKTGYTEGNGNITTHNGSPAMDIRAHIFYQNLENSTSGFLKGYFEANTSYIFDMWIDTDAVIYNGNNVAGGLRLVYTDDSFENTFVFTGGNKGWQHKVYITPSNKTVDRIEVYYYVEQPVYCRLDSCICPLSNLKLHKTGIFEGTNLLEETNTKLIKNALIETNEIIET